MAKGTPKLSKGFTALNFEGFETSIIDVINRVYELTRNLIIGVVIAPEKKFRAFYALLRANQMFVSPLIVG